MYKLFAKSSRDSLPTQHESLPEASWKLSWKFRMLPESFHESFLKVPNVWVKSMTRSFLGRLQEQFQTLFRKLWGDLPGTFQEAFGKLLEASCSLQESSSSLPRKNAGSLQKYFLQDFSIYLCKVTNGFIGTFYKASMIASGKCTMSGSNSRRKASLEDCKNCLRHFSGNFSGSLAKKLLEVRM